MNRYRSEILVCLFLVITTVAVYCQVQNFDFINYDDNDYVTENQHVQAGWTIEGVGHAFNSKFHLHWHPLTWLSHMTDCQLFGLNPGWHHLSSLFLHLVNTLLLFFVLKLMTGALLRSAFVAALFALHPLHVETVVWIADRKDVLSTFFWMLAMLAYARYSKSPGFCRYILVLIALILGLMAKSMVATLPFVLLLMDYWPLKRSLLEQSEGRQSTQNHKPLNTMYQKLLALRLIWDKAFLLIVVGVDLIVTLSAMQQKTGLNVDASGLSSTKHDITSAVISYVSYIGKMFWPINLAIPYPYRDVISAWQACGCGSLLIGISFLVFWKRRHYPYLIVGWLWYLITLVPVIGIVHSGPKIMADRYTYIPLIGLFIIIAWGIPDLLRTWRYRRIVLAVSTGIVIIGLMVSSWFQVRHWESSIPLFRHTLDVTVNNYQAYNYLGTTLAKQGEQEEAIKHYYEALRIKPRYAEVHNNLGNSLVKQGEREEAINHYYKALNLKPLYAAAHNNLGKALAEQGKQEGAIKHYYEALHIKPDYALAHNNLGVELAEQGNREEAIKHYNEALRIKPLYAEAHNNLGVELMLQGKHKEALVYFSEGLRIDPNLKAASNNRDYVLRLLNKSREKTSTDLKP